MNAKNITLIIDGTKITVPENYTIMQAGDSVNIRIPRLCYHSKLSQFGGCRICIVEAEGAKNYLPACATQVREGMKIQTHSAGIRKSRRHIVELLLSNHDARCQTCAKNGECELQSLAEQMGIRDIPFEGETKKFAIDDSSPSLVRDSQKCVLCGKCVRVCKEIQGVNALTFSHRGFKTNVVPAYNCQMAESVCVNCGQCVNACPTGALIERDYTSQVWDNLNNPQKTVIVQIAPAVRVAIGEMFGIKPGNDMTGEIVTALRMLGFKVIFDTQFSADLTIIEEGNELISRIKNGGKLPMFTSCSPGWIKFCEAFHPEFLDNISTCKSPQQMMGTLIKTYYARKAGLNPRNIYSVSIMPCLAKKFEAGRPEMNASGYQDVDAVLTTRELAKMIKQSGIDLGNLKKSEFDSPMGESTGAAPIFGATGGVMEAALRTAYEVITGKELGDLNLKQVRGMEGIRDAAIDIDGLKVNVAIAWGLANTHKLLTEIKSGKRQYHFVEIMTCPAGCLGGGGQPYMPNGIEYLDNAVYTNRASGLYSIDENKKIRKSHENPDIKKIYKDFLGEPLGKISHRLLHTHYHVRLPKGLPADTKETVNLFNNQGA